MRWAKLNLPSTAKSAASRWARAFLALGGVLWVVGTASLWASPLLDLVEGTVSKDFGTVRRREKLEARVVLKNIGDSPVVLDVPRASCSACETLLMTSSRVAPGQQTTLTMRLDSGRETGPKSGEWVVKTNAEKINGGDPQPATAASPSPSPSDARAKAAAQQPSPAATALAANPTSGGVTLVLSAKWTVESNVVLRPEAVQFGRVAFATAQSARVTVAAPGAQPSLQVTSAETTTTFVRAALSPQPDGSVAATVSLTSEAPVGKFSALITFHTNQEREPVLELPVQGEVAGPFALEKPYINFGVAPRSRETVKDIGLSAQPPGTWQVTAASLEPASLGTAECQAAGPGRWRVRVQLSKDLPAGTHRGAVTVTTDCAAQPTVKLDVLAAIR